MQEISEKIVADYSDSEWNEFVKSISSLNNGVLIGVLEIIPLIPKNHRLGVLEELLINSRG